MNNLKIKIKTKVILTFMIFAIPLVIFAKAGIANPTNLSGDLNSTVKVMINGLLKLAIPFLVLAYIYVGFLFAKAQGDAKGLEGARKALIWTLVGTAIVVGGNVIYSVIEDTLKQSALSSGISLNTEINSIETLILAKK